MSDRRTQNSEDFGWLSQSEKKRLLVPDKDFREDFANLVKAIPEILEREWVRLCPKVPEGQEPLVALATASGQVHHLVLFICRQRPRDEVAPPKLLGVLGPLLRTQLDHVFLAVYLLARLKTRARSYIRSGARELLERLDRYRSEYGSDPDFKDLIRVQEEFVKFVIRSQHVSEKTARGSPYQPTPPQMLRAKSKALNQRDRKFLTHLQDWFYREFSQESHAAFPGLIKQNAYFRIVERESGHARERVIETVRSEQIFRSRFILLVLFSELEIALKLGRKMPLLALWTKLCPISPEAKAIFDLRGYQHRLARA
jgi:hypothetical protein